MKTSHQFARELLALPDVQVAVNSAEYNSEPREPLFLIFDDKPIVVFDAGGPPLPKFKVGETQTTT